MSHEIPTDTLARMVDAKRNVLEQIHHLVLRQADFAKEGNVDALMNVLAAKEKLLAQLQPIEQALLPFRDEDPDQRVWRTVTDRQRCRESADRCGQLLAEILQLERTSSETMHRRRDEAAEKLQGTHAAHQARQAYRAHAQSQPASFSSDA